MFVNPIYDSAAEMQAQRQAEEDPQMQAKPLPPDNAPSAAFSLRSWLSQAPDDGESLSCLCVRVC